MKITLKHVLVMMMLLAPRALVGDVSQPKIPEGWEEVEDQAQPDEATTSLTGLEADSTTSLTVLIEILSEEAEKIGLTRERIEARVNQSLRKGEITPVSERRPNEDCLYVSVNVIANGSFTISIEFQRPVFYRSRGKWFRRIGSTWDRSATGYADGDKDYILDRIAEYVEVFCNEFLKANGK